jgi:hypothetical protein
MVVFSAERSRRATGTRITNEDSLASQHLNCEPRSGSLALICWLARLQNTAAALGYRLIVFQ